MWLFFFFDLTAFIDGSLICSCTDVFSSLFEPLRRSNYGLEHWGSDQQGVNNTRRFLLEWMSFLHRYVPAGILEQPYAQGMNQRPPHYFGRGDLETLLSSPSSADWIKVSEMFLGPVAKDYTFIPKHKSNSYANPAENLPEG